MAKISNTFWGCLKFLISFIYFFFLINGRCLARTYVWRTNESTPLLGYNLSATEKRTISEKYHRTWQSFAKVAVRSPIIMSHQKYFEHVQKTSRDWFWSPTCCEGFLEATYQSNHRTVANRSPISRRQVSWRLWIFNFQHLGLELQCPLKLRRT